MTATEIPVDNGVNVEALLGVRNALGDTPEIAQFQWRSTVSWVNGTHSRSDVETFYGFGEEQQHHTTLQQRVAQRGFESRSRNARAAQTRRLDLGAGETQGVHDEAVWRWTRAGEDYRGSAAAARALPSVAAVSGFVWPRTTAAADRTQTAAHRSRCASTTN